MGFRCVKAGSLYLLVSRSHRFLRGILCFFSSSLRIVFHSFYSRSCFPLRYIRKQHFMSFFFFSYFIVLFVCVRFPSPNTAHCPWLPISRNYKNAALIPSPFSLLSFPFGHRAIPHLSPLAARSRDIQKTGLGDVR